MHGEGEGVIRADKLLFFIEGHVKYGQEAIRTMKDTMSWIDYSRTDIMSSGDGLPETSNKALPGHSCDIEQVLAISTKTILPEKTNCHFHDICEYISIPDLKRSSHLCIVRNCKECKTRRVIGLPAAYFQQDIQIEKGFLAQLF